MSNLYQWSVWLHVLAAFLFFFSHGAELATAFMLPKEKSTDGMKTLLNITQVTLMPLGLSMLLLLVTSIHMGVMAGWWMRGWIS